MKQIYRITGDHGVSESIGFLLIFSMVIVGIGLVTLYGYPMLLQQQTSTDKQIMEKNMVVLQNDVKSLAFKTVPYKETMLNTGSGSLSAYNSLSPSSSEVTIHDGADSYVTQFHPGDLRYRSTAAGVDISLQNGAVVMRNIVAPPGSTMIAEPRWFYDSRTNYMVVNLISFNSTSVLSRSGIGDVQMKMNMTNYSVHGPTSGTTCVKYTFPDAEQEYTQAWDNYFKNSLKIFPGACPADEYQLPVTSGGFVVVKKYDVEIVTV